MGFEDSPIEVVRSHHRRTPPRDGTVIDRLWLTTGATEADMRVETVLTCKLALDEPAAFQRLTWLVESLKGAFEATGQVILGFNPFQPKSAQDYFEGASIVIPASEVRGFTGTTLDYHARK